MVVSVRPARRLIHVKLTRENGFYGDDEALWERELPGVGFSSRETGDGRRETGDGRRETGDGRRETGDGRRETGGVTTKYRTFIKRVYRLLVYRPEKRRKFAQRTFLYMAAIFDILRRSWLSCLVGSALKLFNFDINGFCRDLYLSKGDDE